MRKITGMLLLVLGVAGVASAVVSAPEVDPGSAISALTILGGALLLRKRR